MCFKLFIILFASVVKIVLSEDVNSDLKLNSHSDVIFPAEISKAPNNASVLNYESVIDSEIEDKPTPRESKGIKYYSIHNQNYQSRSANPAIDNYENDDYDERIIADQDINDDYDYKSLARNEPINQETINNQNINQINDNRGSSIIAMNENMKKSTSDNPRIISLRDGFNLFRNFWRNRNVDKNKEVLPIITLTTTPTTAPITMEQEQNYDYGTPTGMATGTGTITAISADEIAQNNAVAQSIETPSPFFSFSRKNQPVQYEIIEEYPEASDSNVFAFNGDYIDITSDELEPNDEGKSSVPKISPPVTQKIIEQNQQTQENLQPVLVPIRKNTKLPTKVLAEPIAEIESIEKPKITQEVKKTGLDYYRQYLPNLQKLIEIRPKFFVNRLFPGSKKEVNDIGTQRNFQQRKSIPRRRSNQRIIKRKKPAPKIFSYVNTDQPLKTNRLPVQRVALYVV